MSSRAGEDIDMLFNLIFFVSDGQLLLLQNIKGGHENTVDKKTKYKSQWGGGDIWYLILDIVS